MGVAIGGVEVRLEARHETPMTLQLLRGRDLRPPSRRERLPIAVPTQLQTHTAAAQIEAPARKKALRFPVNRDARAFYRHFYPDTSTAEWNDWRWQMRNRITRADQLRKVIHLTADEEQAIALRPDPPLGITPYFASLMDVDNPKCPIRAQASHRNRRAS